MFFFLFERAEAKLATLSSCSPRNNQFPPSSSLLLDIPQVRSKSHCGLSVDTRLPARANWMEKKSERAIERRRERALAASLDCKTTASISHREEPKAGPLQNSLSSLSSSFSFFFPTQMISIRTILISLNNPRARRGERASWRFGRECRQSSASTPFFCRTGSPPPHLNQTSPPSLNP